MDFYNQIEQFNQMYKLPAPDGLKLREKKDLENFVDILKEEVDESKDLLENYDPNSLEKATELSDWLGDIIVYCHTFARSNGIDLSQVLNIIMESNFSKLGADDKPIYDERGKVMKGPGYWKPEPKIQEFFSKTLS